MFCPKCGKKIPENLAFCPDCGGKLPKIEKNSADISKMTAEQANNAAGSGFDTPGPILVNQQKKNAIAVAVTVAVIAIIGFIIYQADNGGFGTQRNCIASFMGSEPECSDCSSSYEHTIMNGKYYGNCSGYGSTSNCRLSCQ